MHGKELYDIVADRAQESDLATSHPDIVATLRDHYEHWWAELEPLSGQFVPTSLGADAQPVVTLTSSDWQDVYADTWKNNHSAELAVIPIDLLRATNPP